MIQWRYVIEGLLGGLVGVAGMIAWLRWTYAGRRERALMRLEARSKDLQWLEQRDAEGGPTMSDQDATEITPGCRVRVRDPAREGWRCGRIREAFGQMWAVVPDGGGRALLFRRDELEVVAEEEASDAPA
jgi:hypothetical protein